MPSRAPPLWEIDLNLLVVLQVLLEAQSVTQAASRLGRTQSAVSHALNRLRVLFDDELLVRDGRQMKPTLRAEQLAASLPRLLEQVERTLRAPRPFAAATATRTFRLATPDFLGAMLPSLLQRIRPEAPHIRVEMVSINDSTMRDLAEDRFDGLVAPANRGHEGLREAVLGSTPWTVFGRAGHPALEDGTLAAWSRWPHLQIRTRPKSPGMVTEAARKHAIQRTIGAVIPHFAMAASILHQTDFLLTVPEVVLYNAVTRYGLAACPAPLPIPPMVLSLYRSAISGNEPGTRWFLDHLAVTLRPLLEPNAPEVT